MGVVLDSKFNRSYTEFNNKLTQLRSKLKEITLDERPNYMRASYIRREVFCPVNSPRKKVKLLQEFYNKCLEEGIITGKKIAVDGGYGPETTNAIRNLQEWAAKLTGIGDKELIIVRSNGNRINTKIPWAGNDGLFGIGTKLLLDKALRILSVCSKGHIK